MKLIKLSSLLLILLKPILINAQLPQEIPLYPNGIENNPIVYDEPESYVDSIVKPGSLSGENRVFSNVTIPTYMVFPAADSNNKHIGLVIFPGGGLRNNWLDKEGTDLALWLSARGINCLVLKYRTNTRDEKGDFLIDMDTYREAVIMDGKTSMLRMKELADSLNFDKDKVGVVGFSAGGYLAEKITFKYTDGVYDWEPAFMGLVYFGNRMKSIKKVKNIKELPPVFMATGKDDRKLRLHRVLPYLTKIVGEVDNSELHIYSRGVHGFGLAYNDGHSVELWKKSFYGWMLDIYRLEN